MNKSRIDYLSKIEEVIEKQRNGKISMQECRKTVRDLKTEMEKKHIAGDLR